MSEMVCVKKMIGEPADEQPSAAANRPVPTKDAPARTIKAEVNLLRLPLFALHTKGLKSLEGIECRGRIQRDGKVHEYLLRVSRNTSSLYPGPLARKVHFALLSIATECGFPLANPVSWTWRDLCRRMDIAYAGQKTTKEIKTAIRSTHGVVIHSHYALYARADGQPLPLHERGHHLYNDYAFCNELRPDGTIADNNAVWFADWYLENLNAFFSAPINYDLWKSLEARSPTASRLYEFLLLNLYSGAPVFRINYPNLAKLLPVRTERYLSDARKQLGPAFDLLQQAGVLAGAAWGESRDGAIQLLLAPGPLLPVARSKAKANQPLSAEDSLGTVQIAELRSTQPTEWHLVRQFYQLWSGDAFVKPSPKEMEFARELLERHGRTKLHALLPLAVKRMREKWPDAKTFGALVKYLPEINDEYERRQRNADRQKQAHLQDQMDNERREQERKDRQQVVDQNRSAWLQLPDAERSRIENHVRSTGPHVARVPAMFERFCILQFVQEKAGKAVDLARANPAGPMPVE